LIEIETLSKSYGETCVLDAVNLQFERAGVTGVIGPNGAGKSTFLSIVGRIVSADKGRVSVDGLDIKATPGDTIAKRLSILRQDNHMAARLTVRDLVAFGRYPYTKGRTTIEDRAHVDRAISYLGLDDFADRFLDEHPAVARHLARELAVRLHKTTALLVDLRQQAKAREDRDMFDRIFDLLK